MEEKEIGDTSSDRSKEDLSIGHFQTIEQGEDIRLNLNKRNITTAKFPNNQKAIVLFDSGATKSLISDGMIQNSSYLRGIKPETSDKATNFVVAGGGSITSNRTLTFTLIVQGQIFEITAFIVPCIGGIDCIVSTNAMAELEADLNFKTNVLRFKTKTTLAKITRNIILKPYETRIITIKAKVPDIIKNAEVYYQPTPYLARFMPSLMMIRLAKGLSKIAIYNNSSKSIKLKSQRPIGRILLNSFGTVPAMSTYSHTGKCDGIVDPHVYSVTETKQQNNLNTISNDKTAVHDLYDENKRRYPHLETDDPRLPLTREEVLERNLDLTGHCMTENSLKEFWKILKENTTSFALYDEVGDCPNLSVKIKLTDETPFFIRPYPVSELEKDVIDKEMAKLMKMGILEYGKSSYVSPIMLLRKKDNPTNPLRLVTDFRVLNLKIAPLHYCTPLLRDALQIIGGSEAQVFSTIDIKNAFYSLRVDKESQKYLGIAPYPSGRTLKYLRLPQGLCISPTEWNDKIQDILSKLKDHNKFVIGIADDLILYSKNEEDHLEHIKQVLELLGQEGLKISVSKCQFFRKSLKYMGHVIEVHDKRPSIKPQKSKIEAITKLEKPTNRKQLRTFIGMIAYLSMYIPRLQILLTPMHKLTRKNSVYDWTPEIQKNFEEIKQLLLNAPMLTLPAKTGLIRLYVDTSRVGTGGCLCQVQDGQERILAFYSKKLSEAARNYSVTELELHGMYLNILAFRYLLRSVTFEVITDHSSLVNISKSKTEPPIRLQKLFERLSDYKFVIKYKKGKELVIVDYFSRNPSTNVDDNAPIAFPLIEQGEIPFYQNILDMIKIERTCICTENCIDMYCCKDHKKDESIYVATRSQTRASGEKLSTGIAAQSRAKRSVTTAGLDASSAASNYDAIPEKDIDVPTSTDEVIASDPMYNHLSQNLKKPITENDEVYIRPARKLVEKHQEDDFDYEEFQPNPYNLRPRHDRLVQLRQKNRETRFSEMLPEEEPYVAETHTNPEEWLFKKPEPIFNDTKDLNIFHRNMPKQDDLEKMLSLLKKKIITNAHLPVSRARLAQEQSTDPYFKPIYNWLKHGHLPERVKAQRKLMTIAEEFVMAEDVLFKIQFIKETGKDPVIATVCVPMSMEHIVLHAEHEGLMSNHMGVMKTYMTMKDRYYIRGLYNKLEKYIRSCYGCQIRKPPSDIDRPFEMRIPSNYTAMRNISCDIKHMFTSASGNNFILIVVCEITRFTEAIPLKRADAVTISEALLRRIILRYGQPECIYVDADKAFNNTITEFLWNALNT